MSHAADVEPVAGEGTHSVAEMLRARDDRIGDILYIEKRPPYTEQESEELGDDVIARLNPTAGEIENLDMLFFSTRLQRGDLFELPVVVRRCRAATA